MTSPPPELALVPGVPGILAWAPVPGRAAGLAIHVAAPSPLPVALAHEERAWNDLCAANPRLHDADVLSVTGIKLASGIITCTPDRYRRLALQGAGVRTSGPPVWLLGVKGWITARSRDNAEHLLIARRGTQTRVYASLWESAPAGGVESPRSTPRTLSAADLARTLADEAHEELGIDLDPSAAGVAGICRDETARSYDIFLKLELPGPIDPRRAPACHTGFAGWEYSDSAWLARGDAPAFDARPESPMVPPTRAMLRLLGWVP